jgi:hypothetical protein
LPSKLVGVLGLGNLPSSVSSSLARIAAPSTAAAAAAAAMSNALGNVYSNVIEDVINNSRVDFEEAGIDESVLETLRVVSPIALICWPCRFGFPAILILVVALLLPPLALGAALRFFFVSLSFPCRAKLHSRRSRRAYSSFPIASVEKQQQPRRRCWWQWCDRPGRARLSLVGVALSLGGAAGGQSFEGSQLGTGLWEGPLLRLCALRLARLPHQSHWF